MASEKAEAMWVLLQSEKSWCVRMLRLDSGPQSWLDLFVGLIADSWNLQLKVNSLDELRGQWRDCRAAVGMWGWFFFTAWYKSSHYCSCYIVSNTNIYPSIYISAAYFFYVERNCASCGTISDIKHKTRRRRNQITRTTSIYMLQAFRSVEVLHKFASLDKQIQHEISTEVVTITHVFKQNERWMKKITWINKKLHFGWFIFTFCIM